jgi:uncharacterized protein (DUF58 family)
VSSASTSLFDEEFLRKLEYLKLVSSHLVPGHLKGQHRARKTGAGIEFADYRPYVAGEDIKNVDWRAYLRLDKLILRLFEEEGDLPIYIFVDASYSMSYGQPSKFDYGRRVAAALCYLGLVNLDRVTLVAFADGVSAEMSSKRGKSQIFEAFRFLEGAAARGTTRLEAAFRSFFGASRRKGLVVAISDFLDPDGIEKAFSLLRYFRHDVFAVQLVSAEELQPELPDEVVLVDSETGAAERLRVTPALLSAYAEELRRHASEIESYCFKYGWGYARAATEVPFEDLVLEVLGQRRFRR